MSFIILCDMIYCITLIVCYFRVDYGHEEVKVKFGNDPRKFSTLTKEFLDDGKSITLLMVWSFSDKCYTPLIFTNSVSKV